MKRQHIPLTGLAILLLGALACTSAQPTSQTLAMDDKPQYGGIFRAPVTDDPFDYDMSSAGSSNTNPYVIKLAYSTVLRVKTGPGIAYSEALVEPLLAERWEVSPDAKTYTFYLRKGVKYTNTPPVNGRELTSADVKFSYEYLSRSGAVKDAKLPASRYEYMYEGLESIQTPDPYTVVVKFKDSFAPFLIYAASTDAPIMPHEIYNQDKHFKDKVVGSGPFQLDAASGQKGSRWVMKKNPAYFQEGVPYLDEYHMLVISEQATETAAFQSKQIDYINPGTDTAVTEDIRRTVPTAVQYDYTLGPLTLGVNAARPPLNDPRIRKAISLALDRNEAIKVLGGGHGEWALVYTNLFSDLFTQEESKAVIKYNPDEARRLVQQAGFSQGLKYDMVFSGSGADITQQAAELIQAQLKKVGIEIALKPTSPTDAALLRRNKQFDSYLVTVSEPSRGADIDAALYIGLAPNASANYNGVDDPKVNSLLAAQRRETDPAKRREVIRELLKYVNETALVIPTWRVNQTLFWQPYVRDFYQTGDRRTQGIVEKVWLAK